MYTLRLLYPLPVREFIGDLGAGSARAVAVPPDAALFDEFAGIRLDSDDGFCVADLITSGRESSALRVDAGLSGGAFVARHEPAGTLVCSIEFTVARRLTHRELEVLLEALAGYVDHAISGGQGFALELDTGRVFFLEPETASPSIDYT